MSSRKEEKEQRRAERLAAEQEAARGEARKKRLGIVVAAVLGIAAVAAIVVVLVGAGGGGSEPTASTGGAAVPPQRTTDLTAAARAAGCQVRRFRPSPRDREHVTRQVTYAHNPPVFGPHDPAPASDGNYVGQGTPVKEKIVHSLEHGRTVIQYRPGTDPRRVAQLETLLAERPKPGTISGYNALLIENNTNMPYALAVTAWGSMLSCSAVSDATFDAIRAFRTRFVDTGPEFIPQPQ